MSREVYSRLYKNFSMIEAFRTVPLPSEQEGLELVTYPTLAFARSRSLNNANYMLRPGTAARIRALREIIYKVRQVRKSRFDKVRVGIIDHKAVLAAMGYDFHNNAVLSGPLVARQSVAPDLLLDETLAELEGIAELVVGYHGGVVGSNLFKDVRLLAVLGDPTGHIGMLAEEARTMDMSAAGYIRWRVSMNAVQEVFRGRLLDADDANKKTVLYFGRYAPDLTSMGRTWRMLPWPEGGRLLSRPAHAFTAAIWEMIGHSSTIVGTLMPEFAGMHATPIGSLLYALRASEESWDSSSPRTRELYRRTARAVADQQGLRTFDIPHPLGGRKPVPVHAASLEDALKAMAEVEDQLSSMPSWRMKDVAQLAEAAEVQRDADATLSAKVETIRDEVTRLKQEWRQQHEQLQTHNWLRLSSTDLNTTEGRLFADAQDAALATALADLRTCYRQQIADTLAQWRALKGKYKNREPLVTSRAEVLRFAYRGIAF